MRLGSREPGRGECRFVVEKTFRTRPRGLQGWRAMSSARFMGRSDAEAILLAEIERRAISMALLSEALPLPRQKGRL